MDEQKAVESTVRRPSRKRWSWAIALVLLIAGIYFFTQTNVARTIVNPSSEGASGKGGRGGRGGRGAGGPTPVVAARAYRGNIGVYLVGLGTVTPLATVTLKARVDGELMNVNYREGQLVHKGDPLVEIDPRPYQVQLEQAQGQYARDEAALVNARTDLVRYQTLNAQHAIPEQQLATQQATVLQDEATLKSDQGLIDSAKLNLTYTKITAPITGRTGLRLVDSGNIVHASDANGLVVITQIDPISVLFTISEDQLPVIYRKFRAGQKLSVAAFDREMKQQYAQGVLITIDNQIDQTTGTVRLRASFDNSNGTLFPNQFVNARLLVEERRNIVLVPSAAIQRTSNKTFVYLVKPDSSVTIRNVTVGAAEDDAIEITSGLQEGDVVVIMGVDKLDEGSKVTAEIQDKNGVAQPTAGRKGRSGKRQ